MHTSLCRIYAHYCTCEKPGNALAHYRRPRGVRLLLLYYVLSRPVFSQSGRHDDRVATTPLRSRHGFHTTLGGEGRKRWFVYYVYVTFFLRDGRREAAQGV